MDFFRYFSGKDHSSNYRRTRKTDPKTFQKIGRYFLGVSGICALALGVLGLRNQLVSPFGIKTAIDNAVQASETNPAFDLVKDTDSDGIPDFQETYFYHTSPYLADTDGDGIPDKKEIDDGTDPNCAQGTVCKKDTTSAGGGATLPQVPQPSSVDSASAIPSISGLGSANSDIDIAKLRQELVAQGVAQSTVDGIDDATLRQVYAETIAQTPAPNSSLAPAPSSVTPPITPPSSSQQDMSSFTPNQIRDFLKQGGADDATLSGIDDATLKSVFTDAIKNAATQ